MKNVLRQWKFYAAIFVAVVMLYAQEGDGLAVKLRVQNDFKQKMYMVVVYFDDDAQKWQTRGWYRVEPQRERKLNFKSSKTNFYIYAHLTSGSITWGKGDISRTVVGDAFSYFDGEACPAGKNRRRVNFTKYTANNNVIKFRPRFCSTITRACYAMRNYGL